MEHVGVDAPTACLVCDLPRVVRPAPGCSRCWARKDGNEAQRGASRNTQRGASRKTVPAGERQEFCRRGLARPSSPSPLAVSESVLAPSHTLRVFNNKRVVKTSETRQVKPARRPEGRRRSECDAATAPQTSPCAPHTVFPPILPVASAPAMCVCVCVCVCVWASGYGWMDAHASWRNTGGTPMPHRRNTCASRT